MDIVLKLSKLCNLRCNYCYEYDSLSDPARMELDDLSFLFDSIGRYWQAQRPDDAIQFVFHGGEPLLLPIPYYDHIFDLQRRFLDQRQVRYDNVAQTNLYKLTDERLQHIVDNKIYLGISVDVLDSQRILANGKESQEKVLDNMQKLHDHGVEFGAIAVLHKNNIAQVLSQYSFFNALGIDYRILPIFSYEASGDCRTQRLMISRQELVEAYKQVGDAMLSNSNRIKVRPLWDYFQAAVAHMSHAPRNSVDPAIDDIPLQVDIDGSVYTDCDSYSPNGYLGNAFQEDFGDIVARKTTAVSIKFLQSRVNTCRQCEFDGCCSREPMINLHPSERRISNGLCECPVAKALIRNFQQRIAGSKAARELVMS